MADIVRAVQKPTGHLVSVTASEVAENPGLYSVTDRPAVDGSGLPLPPKFHQPKAGKATTATEEAQS